MTKRTIAFVPRRSRIRLYKIAKALKYSNELRLVLVCEEGYYDKKLFEGIFDEVHFYRKSDALLDSKYLNLLSRKFAFSFGLNSLIRILKSVKPDLVHAFCEPYDHIVKILKSTDYPVIMTDGADFSGISGGLENIDPRTRKQEKYSFEHVDGLIYKGPKAVTEFYRRHNYKINCPEMTWLDHCDEDLFVEYPTAKLSNEDNEVHMVYTGNIATDPNVKYCYYPPLGEALAAQKIHLHIYPNPYQFRTSKEYIELDRNEKYFHFHRPLPMKELISEISAYDWGLWVHAEDPSFRTQEDKMQTGIGNKLFTYLEAGLPVIVSDSRKYGVDVVESNEVGFSLNDRDWVNLASIISGIDYPVLREKVLKKREELSLRNNFRQLIDFYNNVIQNTR